MTAAECTDGRKRVAPGDTAGSYVLDKLLGVNICLGSSMPAIGSIASSDVATIANWICEGAPNN